MAWRAFYNWGYWPRHVVVSYDEQSTPKTETKFRRLRTQAYKDLKTMGVHGGLLVFHPWRKRCLQCGAIFEGGRCTDGHRIGFEWLDGPHFHALVYGKVDHDRRPEGVVVKTVPPNKKRSRIATLKYVLDHAGLTEGLHGLTWFGSLAYTKFNSKGPEARFLTLRLQQDTIRVCPFDKAEMVVHFPKFEFAMVVERFPWLNEPPDKGCRCENCSRASREAPGTLVPI